MTAGPSLGYGCLTIMAARIGRYLRQHHLALVAIVLALTGTAYAAGKINGKKLKPHSVPVNRLTHSAKKSLQGQVGPRGAPGSARAYAYVKAGATPSFDAARTKGFTAVSRGADGVYCLTPASSIDLSKTAVAVTPVWNSGIINNAFAQLSDVPVCPSGQLDVFTYYDDGGGFPTAVNAIDFTVVVP